MYVIDYVDKNGSLRVLRGHEKYTRALDSLPVCDLLGVRRPGQSRHVNGGFQWGDTYAETIESYYSDSSDDQ